MEGVAKKRTSFGRRTKSYKSVNRVVESLFSTNNLGRFKIERK
ncbi:hypothetical protein LEP1GSC026_1537 [Leptospira interrogans str. 2002000623]|nr:hypothetical protein LEP1GSC027_1521 [Leptospira interrogans str. 2002000624]EKQ49895.1 hypothetical protein LEP1GSC026_1537 [Leptospira interrogans str. 2002000623]EKR81386.1 hypothetical protein LEP1GSC099_0592 [Leptospira interrogans str. UI 08452]